MRKSIAIPLVVVASIGLGGCSIQLEALYAQALAVVGVVKASLTPARTFIEAGCSYVYREEVRVDGDHACQQKVSKIRRGIEAVCKNTALLTDDVVGNYVATIRNAVKNAETSGC